MATYLEIKSQIDALQREAESLKSKERKGVIARMKEAIAAYEITAVELGLGAAARAPVAKQGRPAKKAQGKVRGKRRAGTTYSDGKGNTWGGMGKRPHWLRDALANGAKLEDFAAKQ